MMELSDRDLNRRVKEFDRLRLRDIEWGREKRARSATVIELDPPLARLDESPGVDVEFFYNYIDNSGGQKLGWRNAGTTVGGWWTSIWKRRLAVRVHLHVPGSGPYLNPEHETARGYYQKLAMGWGRPVRRTEGRGLDPRMEKTLHELWARRDMRYVMGSDDDAERFLKYHGLSVEEWRASLESTRVVAQMRETDERWAEIARRGSEEHAKAFKSPAGPVLLINGRFLITANTMRRHGGKAVRNAYRTASWIVRNEIERIERELPGKRKAEIATLSSEEFAYGMEDGSRPEKAIDRRRKEPVRKTDTVLVEWLYSKVAELSTGLEPAMRAWAGSLPARVSFIEREASNPDTSERARQMGFKGEVEELVSKRLLWRDPVLLIGERYLLVGSKFTTMAQAMRTANTIVRRIREGEDPIAEAKNGNGAGNPERKEQGD